MKKIVKHENTTICPCSDIRTFRDLAVWFQILKLPNLDLFRLNKGNIADVNVIAAERKNVYNPQRSTSSFIECRLVKCVNDMRHVGKEKLTALNLILYYTDELNTQLLYPMDSVKLTEMAPNITRDMPNIRYYNGVQYNNTYIPFLDNTVRGLVDWKLYADKHDKLYVYLTDHDEWLHITQHTITEDTSALVIVSRKQAVCICSDAFSYLTQRQLVGIGVEGEYTTMQVFDTALKVKELFNTEEIENIAEEVVELYKENTEDPFISEEELEGVPICFLCGDEDTLIDEITLLVQAIVPLSVWDESGLNNLLLRVRAAEDDGENAMLDSEDMEWSNNNSISLHIIAKAISKIKGEECGVSDLETAFDAIVCRNTPYGYTMEYNDGAYDRASGYSKTAQSVEIDVPRPSAHTQIIARTKLKEMADVFSKELLNKIL